MYILFNSKFVFLHRLRCLNKACSWNCQLHWYNI